MLEMVTNGCAERQGGVHYNAYHREMQGKVATFITLL